MVTQDAADALASVAGVGLAIGLYWLLCVYRERKGKK
jgi:hypothetical protein